MSISQKSRGLSQILDQVTIIKESHNPIKMNIPQDNLHIILAYDGRIKYKKGKYYNIIHKYDDRYTMIERLLKKKRDIMNKIEIRDKTRYYFEFCFNMDFRMGLCYDYNFSYKDEFEICFYDFRNGITQIRTSL
jgi:hypothetical protein